MKALGSAESVVTLLAVLGLAAFGAGMIVRGLRRSALRRRQMLLAELALKGIVATRRRYRTDIERLLKPMQNLQQGLVKLGASIQECEMAFGHLERWDRHFSLDLSHAAEVMGERSCAGARVSGDSVSPAA